MNPINTICHTESRHEQIGGQIRNTSIYQIKEPNGDVYEVARVYNYVPYTVKRMERLGAVGYRAKYKQIAIQSETQERTGKVYAGHRPILYKKLIHAAPKPLPTPAEKCLAEMQQLRKEVNNLAQMAIGLSKKIDANHLAAKVQRESLEAKIHQNNGDVNMLKNDVQKLLELLNSL